MLSFECLDNGNVFRTVFLGTAVLWLSNHPRGSIIENEFCAGRFIDWRDVTDIVRCYVHERGEEGPSLHFGVRRLKAGCVW